MMERDSLKVITITVFTVLFFKICIGCIDGFFGLRSSAGEWDVNYTEIIEMAVYLAVIVCLVKSRGREMVQKGKNRRKWLYVIPILFIAVATLHRVYFLKEGLEEYFAYPQRSIYFGYEEDYNNLLRESAILLLLFSIINPLVYGKRTEKKGTGKFALVAAVLFIMLAIWDFYRIVFIVLYNTKNNFRFGVGDQGVQLVPLLCGFGLLAFWLLRGAYKFLPIGAGFVILYNIIYCCAYPQDMEYVVQTDFSYLLGYVGIAAFSVVTYILKKRGRKLKSKWWLAFPIVFLILDIILKRQLFFVGDYSFIDDYQCLVHCLAIFFAMLWAIYSDGLPKGRETA